MEIRKAFSWIQTKDVEHQKKPHRTFLWPDSAVLHLMLCFCCLSWQFCVKWVLRSRRSDNECYRKTSGWLQTWQTAMIHLSCSCWGLLSGNSFSHQWLATNRSGGRVEGKIFCVSHVFTQENASSEAQSLEWLRDVDAGEARRVGRGVLGGKELKIRCSSWFLQVSVILRHPCISCHFFFTSCSLV